MKTAVYLFLTLLFILISACQPSLNLNDDGSCSWIDFSQNDTVVQNGYQIHQDFDPNSFERKLYLQRESDKEPVLIYTHGRAIEARLANQGGIMLINDHFATKACKVFVVDLQSQKKCRIDENVRQAYRRDAPAQWHARYAIPEAVDICPNDKMVLIEMKSGYMAKNFEDAEQFGQRFQAWSYVVNPMNGEVMHCYQTNGIVPKRWWVF